MTVLETSCSPLTVGKNKISKRRSKKVAEEYMQLTNVKELAGKNLVLLSGGNNNVWPSLVHLFKNLKYSLLDEPLSNGRSFTFENP